MAKESIKSASISADKSSPEKERALSAALAQIERQFGKGSMMRLGPLGPWANMGSHGPLR